MHIGKEDFSKSFFMPEGGLREQFLATDSLLSSTCRVLFFLLCMLKLVGIYAM